MPEAHVVGSFVVHMLSFIAIDLRESLFDGLGFGNTAAPCCMLPIVAGSLVGTHAFNRLDCSDREASLVAL